MNNYRIISLGKIKENFYVEGVKEYIKRLGPYTRLELLEGLEERVPPRASDKDIEKILYKEGQRVLSQIKENELLVVLDIQGKLLTSEDLASAMNKWNQSDCNRVNLVIGSSWGLSAEVKKRADQSISLSRFTFPHQMAVLILVEQLYRGYKILKGEPYHK